MFPLINITPDPVLIQIGPFSIGWYGIGYVIAIAVLLLVAQREAERRGYERAHILNAFLIVFVLALGGGRLYHVIDQWDEIYVHDPLSAILPIRPGGAIGFSGLGVFGGIAGAALGIILYTRWKRIPLALGLDVVIPGTLFAQGIARWGNFFNQELYGPPTDLPWGIAIECQYRVPQYPCTQFPEATTGFHPLFFYESALTILGGLIALYLSRRYLQRLQLGDLAAFWGIWYGLVRAALETLREGWNWTVGGIPTAQVIGISVAVVGVAWIAWNHRPGTEPYPYLAPIVPEKRVDPFEEEEEEDEFEEDEDRLEEDDVTEDEEAGEPDEPEEDPGSDEVDEADDQPTEEKPAVDKRAVEETPPLT